MTSQYTVPCPTDNMPNCIASRECVERPARNSGQHLKGTIPLAIDSKRSAPQDAAIIPAPRFSHPCRQLGVCQDRIIGYCCQWRRAGSWCRCSCSHLNTAITDVASNDVICNTNFIQPMSNVVASVPAGGVVAAEFHHTSAGYTGPDPADPLDPEEKGPVLAYLAAIPDATQAGVTGLQWFKIFEEGLNTTTHQWGSDLLFINKGYVNTTIPSCVKAGQYLLRVEYISLIQAAQYPGAQLFMSCAQIEVTEGGDATPETVSFPGAYTPTSVVTDLYNISSYTAPGPAVFTC